MRGRRSRGSGEEWRSTPHAETGFWVGGRAIVGLNKDKESFYFTSKFSIVGFDDIRNCLAYYIVLDDFAITNIISVSELVALSASRAIFQNNTIMCSLCPQSV